MNVIKLTDILYFHR